MMKKRTKIILISIGVLLVVWFAMFVTDYMRCGSLKEPIFVVSKNTTADDGGSGTYQGLGYSVYVEKNIDAEYGVTLVRVEMSMFGKVVSAAIV